MKNLTDLKSYPCEILFVLLEIAMICFFRIKMMAGASAEDMINAMSFLMIGNYFGMLLINHFRRSAAPKIYKRIYFFGCGLALFEMLQWCIVLNRLSWSLIFFAIAGMAVVTWCGSGSLDFQEECHKYRRATKKTSQK